MDNKKEVKQFNKKLLIIFFTMIAIFATLLAAKNTALAAPAQIESRLQGERPNPAYLTYSDLVDYYDILCCQHGTTLNSEDQCSLTGSYDGTGFSYDMSKWQDTGYSVGSKIEEHTRSSMGSGFNSSEYSHRTLGYYTIQEHHTATPKEAYIIAEMRLEVGQDNTGSSAEVVYRDGQARQYTGSLNNAISVQLATGETAYTVNQVYVLTTDKGSYYVKLAKDSDGNTYYVYETRSDGSLREYHGDFTIKDPKTGEKTDCVGVEQDNVFYEYRGELKDGNEAAGNNGTLYLVNYDMVVKKDDKLCYALVTNSNSYIQLAWWTTDMGTSHGTVAPSAPNALAKEAEAFESYILDITGKTLSSLKYEKQNYKFTEGGVEYSGSVEAPVIDYKPGFNKDADLNGVENEADEVTVSFNANENKYVIGPFSIHYTKSSVSVPGRDKVEFSSISGVNLETNKGKLELGKDWNFHYLTGQSRDTEEGYDYPNPDEVFYIDINYQEGLTKINKFEFEFKYMNAGAELDIYKGQYNEVKWKAKYQDSYSACADYANCGLTHYHADGTQCVDPAKTCTSDHYHFSGRSEWLECTSVTPSDSQTLAHALIGARWYETKKCSKEFLLNSSSIKIVKTTYDENGDEKVPVEKTYHFKVYVDGKEFEELSITTKDGVGEASTTRYVWLGEEAPNYEVVEIGDNKNDGPWKGTLEKDKVIEIDAKNFVEPYKGRLKVDKKLLNPTPALQGETFKFIVTITGTFSYGNGPITKYSANEPLRIKTDGKDYLEIVGDGEWTSNEFKWYGAAPKYKVEEYIESGATYELVNGEVSNGNGYIKNSDEPTVATATNAPTTDWTIIEVDKRMVSETTPQPNEVFKAHLTLKGKFRFDGETEIRDRVEEIDIVLNEGNNWHWNSERIEWNKDEVPEYTIKEVEMADGTDFFSISDEVKNSKINEFDSKLNPEKTKIIITNSRENKLVGKLKIIKNAETEDLFGKDFFFKVTVSGTFEYNGVKYNDASITLNTDGTVGNEDSTVSIHVDDKLENTDEWVSGVFKWNEQDKAPQYTVEEVNLPDGAEFVSISNEQVTYTSTQKINGPLNGKLEGATTEENTGLVVVTCTNKGVAKKNAHIVIIKESTDESIDDINFFFKVTITGTFRYYDIVKDDGTLDCHTYKNETLVLDGNIRDVEAVCGGEDWVSELIEWDEGQPAPTYTVEEISIPENIEFVSISNREKTSKTTRIDGVLSEGTENNYITAINKPGPDFVDGSIRIVKKGSEALKGQKFYFDLKVTGEFDYAGQHYGPNGTYELKHIEVECNGNPWISGVFTWNSDGEAPQYTIEEVELPEGSQFVSISNEKDINSNPDGAHSISGTLSLTKPAKIVAINYGGPEPTGSHIEITKEVLNEKLKGRTFYFDVVVESDSPFRYRDLEDATKVTEYNTPDTDGKYRVTIENVPVVADEKDWVSGYFEWDEGASVPTYRVTEKYENFFNSNGERNEIDSVSIRNDREIKAFGRDYNLSGRNDLPEVTGSLNGDITHIIAVNDAEEEAPVSGRIIIEKKALSDIIEGEEFTFTLTITGKFKYNGVDYRKYEETIKITANGPRWESGEISWYEKDGNPTYTVTEDTATFSDGEKFVSIRNAYQTNTQPAITGTVEPNFDNWVLAENTFDGYDKGRIQIHKVLVDGKGNQIDGVDFTFKVVVTFADGSTQEDVVTVTSGGYWRSDWYTWSKKDEAPSYHVEEIDNEGYKVSIDKPDGKLVAQNTEEGVSGIVTVKAQNVYDEEHKAKINVKKILDFNDKVGDEAKENLNVSFTALVKVTGNFTYNTKAYNDETLTLRVVLSKDNNWEWTSQNIYWNGDEAPVFTVEEPSETMPAGWHLVSTEVSPDDNTLKDGGTAKVEITNEWRYDEELILTMKLGGKVWDDTNREDGKPEDTMEDGRINEGESGISNVKVIINRVLVDKQGNIQRKLNGVYAYDENNLSTLIDNWTYTDDNGNWSFGAISVPAATESDGVSEEELKNYIVTYDVEFEYDGQTYEPTKFLAESNGDAQKYINSSTSEKDKYLDNSMALDDPNERAKFNSSFEVIQGKDPMDDDGNTVGTTNTGKELNYTSVDSVSYFNSDNTRKISTLKTVNEDGEIYDDLKMSTKTSHQNLTFPFYNDDPSDQTTWHLKGWDKTITDVFKITYKFEAVYNYCLSINLGLVEREAADVAVEKDLTEALVVVNGKALRYRFNTALDLENPDNYELLYKQLAVADSQIKYNLGLYEGDYYYRASVYNGSEAGNALNSFYTNTLNLPVQSTEMEIYLTYTIKVHNESATYDVKVGELADYYDSSFKLVNATETRYIQTLNGKEVNSKVEVAKPSTITFSDGGTENVSWSENATINGSDGVTYKKIVTSNIANKKLATGETATITATFRIDKDEVNNSNIKNAIKLGEKHNLVEITKFTSYYSAKSGNRFGRSQNEAGKIAGRVDEDSAPDNVNVAKYNDKAYYEDDTDSAPIITIGLKDEEPRAISGIVWDDAQTKDVGYGQVVGNGLYDPKDGDKLIKNATVEIYESISIPEVVNGKTVYKEYQFAWPTREPIADLGNNTIYDLIGFDQSTVTSENGEYTFYNIPAGNYKVRYVYGDKEIATGNTDSIVVYNGQDYKTTAYQIGFDNDKDNDGYVDNEWHDITNSELSDLRVNDARDDEARRLYISAKSEMLTYENSELLSRADNKEADYTDLFGTYDGNNPVVGDGYYMYAETAKIDLGVEKVKTDTAEIASVNGEAKLNGQDVGTPKFIYTVKNVDCGIEERSQTKLTLDKQIKEIVLTTSDDKVILDAIYDIKYDLKQDGTITSSVVLNKEKSISPEHIASLNRNGGTNQGYRYVIADSQILQGAKMKVQYQLTVFNMSETDRISKDLETLWDNYNKLGDSEKQALLNNAIEKVSSKTYIEDIGRVVNDNGNYVSVGYGTYFGSVYYLGSQGVGTRPDEVIVKTKVHEMIDYVDPDVEFKNEENTARNQSWANTDMNYLISNGLIDKNVIQVLDNNGTPTGRSYADGINADETPSIISDKSQQYVTETKNNLVLAMSDGSDKESGTNPGFIKYLEPFMANRDVEKATGTISLNVSRFYSSESDAEDIDNLAEILKVENTAGRRDARNIAGNANPFKSDDEGEPIGIYAVANLGREKDASATELITLSPPTGLSPEESRLVQLAIVVLISVTIVAVAIVVIKKKVLIKK